ncbi:MAG: hypothetical protein LWX07_12920, partial [Bacteroidetes bacterium]|nr:hypothetical protein [Bacteroidota bacterium]
EDVNVSVTGGTRIEIKGVPSLKRIPLLTYNEAMRQWNLLRLREELKKRNITSDTFESHTFDITRILRKTKYQPIATSILEEKIINAVILRGFKGLLNWQTQTETYFSKEISDRLRVIACLSNLPNIIHSDSTSETISIAEWQKVKKAISAKENDTVVIVWGCPSDVQTATKEIAIRAKEAAIGVPSETRQALKDGTTGFERILPGPDRMYPDTDLPPKRITGDRIERIKATLPDYYWEREKWYRELNVPEDLIEPLAISKLAGLFRLAVTELGIDPKLAAKVLIQYPKRLRKMKVEFDTIDEEVMSALLRAYKQCLISKEGILIAMHDAVKYGMFDLDNLPPPIDEKDVTHVIQYTYAELNRKSLHKNENIEKVLCGNVMNKVRGRVDGTFVSKAVSKFIKELK